MTHSAAIQNAVNVADGVAILLTPNAEVIVHDIATECVIHIANNFSKREIGDPSNLKEIEFDPQEQVIGPYDKVNWDGRLIKSISIVIRDEDGSAAALVCINLDLSQFDQARQILTSLMNLPGDKAKPEKLFNDDWHEQINAFINAWATEQNLVVERLDREQKKALVVALDQKNAFAAKHSVNYVARVLGLGRATIYNYLKES